MIPEAVVERAMKMQEVILRAMAKRITWWQAAEILGLSDRQMRRWHRRWEKFGYDGLWDRRSGRPSPRRVPLELAERVLGLYRELFGHEKGAFTGAITQRIGRFELANHGTVFLDEVGEIPLELQPKLLRVLQEREFERLGSNRTQHTDARLIAATNRDLAVMLEHQKFRSDLFYRLNVFPVRVPPLRDRSEDIPLLVQHFTQQFARRMNKGIETIPSETMNILRECQWPGNIRELQNVIERAVILSSGPELRLEFSDLRKSGAAKYESSAKPTQGNLQRALQETERRWILRALEQTRWVVAGPCGAANHLGVKRTTLQFKMRKLGISRNGPNRILVTEYPARATR